MPHFSVEYSANLDDRYDMQELARLIGETAVATGMFPRGGVRVRLYPAKTVWIADGHPNNAFVAVLARIGAGREKSAIRGALETIADAMSGFFETELAGEHFMLSLDVIENDPDMSIKINTIHARLKRQA